MLLRKQRIRKKGKFWKLKAFFLFAVFVILVSVPAFLIYLYFFADSSFYINPVLPFTTSGDQKIKNSLVKKHIEFSKITTSQDSVRVLLKDGSEVIFSSKKDIESQISSLQLTLARLTIEDKKLKTLDFRFDSPVISFK